MASLRKTSAQDKAKALRNTGESSVETLAKAVDAVRASEDFRRYLDTQARFHSYSWCNTLLIASQRPDATRVAGFQTWKKLGRHVKKGEHGAILVHRDGVAVVPAYPVELGDVVDPTGAGDAFAGGMMGYLASANKTDFASIQTALAWGTVTASFALESFGLDRLTEISRADIDKRMKAFRAAARVG